jgi:hypothetical protein
MLRRISLVALALIAVSCSYLEAGPSTTTTTSGEPGSTIPAITPATTTTIPGDSPCLSGDRPFSDNGVISAFGGPGGDATQISTVQWASHPGCEQVVAAFLTADGAPARALDPVGVEFESDTGIIRVSLASSVVRSAVADSRFDGELITRAYVVATDDGLAIDLHLAAGRSYGVRAYEVDSPSRIVIDVREDAEAQPVIGATFGADVVVVTPSTGPVAAPLRVIGYVSDSYDDVTADLVSDGQVVASQTTTPAEGGHTWRQYTMVFREVPSTPLRLLVTPGADAEHVVEVEIDGTTAVEINSPDI